MDNLCFFFFVFLQLKLGHLIRVLYKIFQSHSRLHFQHRVHSLNQYNRSFNLKTLQIFSEFSLKEK